MPITQKIPTQTSVSVIGNNITIKTYYLGEELPEILFAKITDIVGSDNGTPYIEGELLIEMLNYLLHIDCYVDGNGNLILQNNTGDTEKYSIDNDGYLTYTY